MTTKTHIINKNKTRKSVERKLRTYLLDKTHRSGKEKANWFDKALGFNQSNAGQLAKQIVFNKEKAVKTGITEHGTNYNQIIRIVGANGRIIDVNFAWIKNNDNVIRLVTAIPTKK